MKQFLQKIWWAVAGSNCRPLRCQRLTLPSNPRKRSTVRSTLLALCVLGSLFSWADPGQAHPSHLSRAMADIGRNPTGLSHQWCGTIMHRWTGAGGNTAASFMRVGRPSAPVPGAIVVSRGGHHVGIIIRCEASRCLTVSGNHTGSPGHRVVGTGWYSKSSFNSVRML